MFEECEDFEGAFNLNLSNAKAPRRSKDLRLPSRDRVRVEVQAPGFRV